MVAKFGVTTKFSGNSGVRAGVFLRSFSPRCFLKWVKFSGGIWVVFVGNALSEFLQKRGIFTARPVGLNHAREID